MFLLQSILDFVHFLQTIIFYIWNISLHVGRGTFILLKSFAEILHDLYKGFIILGEELLRFFTEINASIENTTIYISNCANSGIIAVIDGIAIFLRGITNFVTSSEVHTRLLATRLGVITKGVCALIYGSLILITDTIWWSLTLIPRSLFKLVIAIADFCIFSFDAIAKAFIYAAQTLFNDVFRITISLFVIFTVWKKRQLLHFLVLRCYVQGKMFLARRMESVLSRYRNLNRPRFGNFTRPPTRRSPLPRFSRPALNEFKFSYQQICVVCRDNPKSVLLWPCRHMCLCEECADRIIDLNPQRATCPLCRSEVEFSLSIYT